ncbi:hypothetical protein JXB31_00920 [Candidatus Woesearchaeota archaeon]|nr:hypothetical protein [Candidatus Woesearchaeota archaeon]
MSLRGFILGGIIGFGLGIYYENSRSTEHIKTLEDELKNGMQNRIEYRLEQRPIHMSRYIPYVHNAYDLNEPKNRQ